jgi:hypothetical protein
MGGGSAIDGTTKNVAWKISVDKSAEDLLTPNGLGKILPPFHGTRTFITVFRRSRHFN